MCRAALTKSDLVDVVAVNDPFLDTKYAAYQFQYDSVHGKYPTEITYDKENIIIDGKKIRVYNFKDPQDMSDNAHQQHIDSLHVGRVRCPASVWSTKRRSPCPVPFVADYALPASVCVM